MAEFVPSLSVRGMKKLDRELFSKTTSVPCLKVKSQPVSSMTNLLKNYLLKLRNLKAIRPVETENEAADNSGNTGDKSREILLNPKLISSFNDISEVDREKLAQLGVVESSFGSCPLQLTYDNWSADDVLKAVLPEGVESAASYSQIGHIVHVNLRDHLQDYKYLIGEVLLDKIKQARTVVNKVDTIDNTFRVFKMEVLAGEHDFVTEVKENYLRFKFDFSSVYWNPRLSTERERIVNKFKPGNILYDVFAGVGPFSIPVAKKECTVLANDLNPESFKWLQYNTKLNKLDKFISVYNKDGIDFIREDVKQHMLQLEEGSKVHVIMNLPATAVTFLTAFKGLFSVVEMERVKALPLVHVYCFVKGERDSSEMAKELVENELNCSITNNVDEITFVRNVAPSKDMMRVSFQLSENILLSGKRKFDFLKEED